MRLIDADELKKNAYPSREWNAQTHSSDLPVVDVSDFDDAPTVSTERNGEVIWKTRCTGGYEYMDVKCEHCGMVKCVEIRHPLKNDSVPYCSECGKRMDDGWRNYCSFCGAKMVNPD